VQLIREMLIRHPNRCTHNAVCIPVCPTAAWQATKPFGFESSKCLEGCTICIQACPSGAIYAVYRKAGTVVEPRKAS